MLSRVVLTPLFKPRRLIQNSMSYMSRVDVWSLASFRSATEAKVVQEPQAPGPRPREHRPPLARILQ